MRAAHGTVTAASQPAPPSRPDRPPKVVLAVLVAFGGGASAAMMNTLNGLLGEAGTGPLLAATISYAVTLLGASALFVARRRVSASWGVVRAFGSWWWFAVGLLAVPLVVGFAWGVPLLGVALAVVCTVAGQVVASLVLDALGIGARVMTVLTPRRAGAGMLALVGVVIATLGGTGNVEGREAIIVAGALFLAGALSVGGQAGSGKIMARIEDPFVAAMTTSTGGFIGISLVVGARFASGAMDGLSMPTQWWLYCGGLFGLVVGIAGAFAVRHLGTFVLTVTVLGGQMVTALTIDAFSPVGVHGLTLVATVVVVMAALLVIERAPRTTPGHGRHGATRLGPDHREKDDD